MESKLCIFCNTTFNKKSNCSKKDWATRQFCSISCSRKQMWKEGRGKTQFFIGMVAPNKGKVYTEEQRKGMKLFEKGHTKVGTEHLKKWRENGGTSWNKGKAGTYQLYGGSKAPFKKAIRGCQMYINWRTNILKRDNYTCLECGRKRKPGDRVLLEVDHIIPFSQILIDYQIDTLEKAYNTDLLWDESNGRTLCKECHKKTESHGSNQWKQGKTGCLYVSE